MNINKYLLISAVSVSILAVAIYVANAWTNPTAAPPGGGGVLFHSGGNVGIGTTAPGARLDVAAGALGTTVGNQLEVARFQGTTANADIMRFFLDREAAGTGWDTAKWKMQRRVDVTDMGYIELGHHDSDLITFGRGTVELMRINNAGNVGIGITGPTGRLHVRGGNVYVDNINFGGTPTIALAVGDTDTGLHSTADGALDIFSNNVNTMSIRSGRVGIGTSTPAFTLDVWGSARVRDTLIIPVK